MHCEPQLSATKVGSSREEEQALELHAEKTSDDQRTWMGGGGSKYLGSSNEAFFSLSIVSAQRREACQPHPLGPMCSLFLR